MNKILIVLTVVFMFSTSFFISKKAEQQDSGEKTNTQRAFVPQPIKKPTVSTAEEIYSAISFDGMNTLNPEVFKKAFLGFQNLKKAGALDENSNLLSICDFSLSSNTKRLWVIDVDKREVVFNSLVAHGKNTGEEFATKFSNIESSYQSSMGFYLTDVTYHGENGYSLKLLGMDNGYNDAALKRAIVMHGADYVSESFAAQHKRIGRSWGCPAVPREIAQSLIDTIKEKNCLFIYYPDEKYLSSSKWLKSPETI